MQFSTSTPISGIVGTLVGQIWDGLTVFNCSAPYYLQRFGIVGIVYQ